MNIIKKLICIMYIIVILFTFSACKKDNLKTVGESPVPMHSVTQNSEDNYITFKFDIPKNWKSYEKDSFVVQAFDTKYLEMEHIDILKELSIILYVSNYEESSFIFDENQRKMYDDLLNGNPNTYKENTIKSLEQFESTLDSFKCDYYNGKKGTIIKVEITATSKDNITATTVQCFRSDIPQYLVTGDIDESLDLSSGDIALWVMDSLEVTEHFNIEDR